MDRLLKFESTAGTFHVARDDDKRIHILFNGESLWVNDDIADAVDSFVNESGFYILHPEMGYPLDLFDLSVCDDISGWEPC